MSPNKSTNKAARRPSQRFTDEERAAMKERSQETKAARAGKPDRENEVLAKIAEMQPRDEVIAKRIHEIIKASAPDLLPQTWYGMPAYAKDGKIVCHFQPAAKFRTRYATLGFSDTANLDKGTIWPGRVRAEGADSLHRGQDRGTHRASAQLRTDLL